MFSSDADRLEQTGGATALEASAPLSGPSLRSRIPAPGNVPAVKCPAPTLILTLTLMTVGAPWVVAVGTALDAPPAFATTARDDVKPCADGQEPGPGERCTGPVDNSSGGGGGGLTIAVSVAVGLAIAGVAFVVLRRQLASMGRPPGEPGPATSPGPGAREAP